MKREGLVFSFVFGVFFSLCIVSAFSFSDLIPNFGPTGYSVLENGELRVRLYNGTIATNDNLIYNINILFL